jgi:hypothetical protein
VKRKIANFRTEYAALLKPPEDITAELIEERKKADDPENPALIAGLPDPEPVRQECEQLRRKLSKSEEEIEQTRENVIRTLDEVQKGGFELLKHAAILTGIVKKDGVGVNERMKGMAGGSPVGEYAEVVQRLQDLLKR